MPNITVSAAAGGLPTRRRALATLAATGAALSLPRAAEATIPGVEPDTDLIAFASDVEALARRVDVAFHRRSILTDKAEGMQARRPIPPRSVEARITRADEGLSVFVPAASPEMMVAQKAHALAVQAWEAERERIARRVGLRAIERLSDRLADRLDVVAADLAAMRPQTLAGLVAKARAIVVAGADGAFEDSSNLTLSLVRDVIAIGGAA